KGLRPHADTKAAARCAQCRRRAWRRGASAIVSKSDDSFLPGGRIAGFFSSLSILVGVPRPPGRVCVLVRRECNRMLIRAIRVHDEYLEHHLRDEVAVAVEHDLLAGR